ncbi:MAG: STAS domain-containing protein [Planctomycetes bacterium]|nr:STAS domain-containing protein [Planctomycetota bacterium]
MEFSTGKTDGIIVLKLGGAVRAGDNDALQDALGSDDIRKSKAVIIDLSDLEYLNSRAIGTLMSLWKETTSSGRKIHIVNPKPLVERLLKAVGMYTLVPVSRSVEDAAAALSKGE